MREVIDDNQVEELPVPGGNGPADPLVDLIRKFLLDGPDQVELLLKALKDQHLAQVERGALVLEGTAGSLGALELQATCERLESASRQHQRSEIRDLGRTLRHDFEEAFGTLGDLLQAYG